MKHIKTRFTKTSITCPPTETGLSIEETIRRAIASNQPIDGKAPMIYTPASEGVNAAYNIRTDKHDLALLAQDKYQSSELMKGFITATEYDENGYDGKGNKRPEPEPEPQPLSE